MKYLSIIIFLSVALIISCSDDDNNVKPAEDPKEYIDASGINGGILFDKFWSVEAKYDQESPNLDKFKAHSDFFRCKQCHGWDLQGKKGAYISRGPKTSRPNIADRNLRAIAKNMKPQDLFNSLKNGVGKDRRDIAVDLTTYDPATNSTEGDKMPKLSQILTDAQLWDIVKYLKVEALDVTELYDATYTGEYPTGTVTFTNIGKGGDAAKGMAFYKANCESCHGADGTKLLMENMTAGKFTRSKPYEVQHKVKFGQLGSTMKPTTITLQEMKDLYKALSDTDKFPD